MEELTIVLLGKQGAGKSASGNTLLGSHAFHTAPSSERVTQACLMSMSTVDKQKITVIDTPGWCDSSRFETEMKQNIIEFVNKHMPHVFLLVLPIGRFTTEEITTVMNILKEFGDEVIKYMIVLFTKGDELEERPIEDYLKELHSDLKAVIQVCGGRYHVFNNRNKKDRQQISSLLMKINEMVMRNEEKWYTKAMYNKNKRQLRNEAGNRNQVSSFDGDRKDKGEKEEEKGKEETLDDRKDLEMLKWKTGETTLKPAKTTQERDDKLLKDMSQQKKDIQQLQRELKMMQGELDKTKNELQELKKLSKCNLK